jgi:hypothetical protein
MKKKRQALLFAYQSLWGDYKSAKRSRHPDKGIRMEILMDYLKTLQKIMVDDYKIKCEFAKFDPIQR